MRRLKAVLLLVFGAWLLSGLARGQGMDAPARSSSGCSARSSPA